MKKRDSSYLKQYHRTKALDYFLSNEEFTRSDVIDETGLSAVTIMKIFDYFLENGFLLEVAEASGSNGRRAQIYKLNSSAAFSIGIECNGENCIAALIDLSGNIFYSTESHFCGDFDEWIKDSLPQIIEDMFSMAGDSKILGLGIAVPGVVDPKNNSIEFAPMLNINTAFSCDSFIKSIQDKYKILVLMENDVNCSVVAEQKIRHESNAENIAYIALGQGLGAGLIINGRLHRGRHNSSGEIGYMIWDSSFKSDRSHDGFLESRINTNALLERWPEILEDNIPPDVLIEATEYVSEYLSLCIANIQTMIDLDLIVIGGVWGEKLGVRLLNKVLEKHKRFCVISADIDLSKIKKSAVVGVAQLVMIEELSRIFRE